MNNAKTHENRYWMIGLLLVIAVVLIVVFAIGKCNSAEPVQNTYEAMGTAISSSIYADSSSTAKDLSSQCREEIERLENREISWRVKGSDIWNLNHKGKAEVSPETAAVIRQCLQVADRADGNYDITIGKLTTLWNIGTDQARVPSQSEIDAALPYVDYRKVKVDGNQVLIGKGQFLDLGGIGKGYAADRCAAILKKGKAKGGVVAVGGSVALVGRNPSSENGKWTIGIQDPKRTHNDTCMTFTSGPCFVSTSGDYEKVLEVGGKKYHHILDPRTGYPAESPLTSVTIIADNGALTDALATSCYIYGYGQKSLSLLKRYHAEGVFIAKDGIVYATPGIRSQLKLTASGYHFS